MKKIKKGFTLVELVVVIAVIAILSGVSVLTYTGVTTKAYYTNDISLVTEWNTILDTDEILNGSPYCVVDVQNLFKENDTNESTFTPKSKNYHFYWYDVNNTIYLVDNTDNGFEVANPIDSYSENVTIDNSYRLDLEYCPLTGEVTGLTFNKSALVVGEENTITITGDSIPNTIKINDEILTVTDGKFTVTPANTNTLVISPDPTVYVSSVSIDPTNLNLFVGANSTLTAVIVPSNADNKNVAWSTSDENIATVSESGLVTAISEGSATITVTTEDGSKTGTCNVIVSKNNATVTTPTAKTNLIYSGSEIELVSAGITNGGTWQYKLDGEEYSTTVPKAKDAGTYNVCYKLVGDNAYNDINEASVQVTIAAKSLSNDMIAVILSQTYSGSALTPDITVKNGETTLIKDTDYTVSYTNNTNAGTATVTITGKGNYTDTATKTFTINKAPQTAPIAPNKDSATVTSTSVTLAAISAGQGATKYGYSEENDASKVTNWQDSVEFTGLKENTTYYFFAKYVGDSNYNEAVSEGTEIKTKESVFAITNSLTNVVADSGNVATINTGKPVTLTYAPAPTGDYSLPTSKDDITVTGATIDSWTPTNDNGKNTSAKLVLSNPIDDVTITIGAGNVPTITTQPRVDYEAYEIDTFVVATGDDLSYQWYVSYFANGTEDQFEPIVNATNSSYTQTGLIDSKHYSFKCRVSNKYGYVDSNVLNMYPGA